MPAWYVAPFSVCPPTPYWNVDWCSMIFPGPVVKTTPGVDTGDGVPTQLPRPGYKRVLRRLNGKTRRGLELKLHVVRTLVRNDRIARDPDVGSGYCQIRILEKRHRDGILQRNRDKWLLRHADDLRCAWGDLRCPVTGSDARDDWKMRRRYLRWERRTARQRLVELGGSALHRQRSQRDGGCRNGGWKDACFHSLTMPNARVPGFREFER